MPPRDLYLEGSSIGPGRGIISSSRRVPLSLLTEPALLNERAVSTGICGVFQELTWTWNSSGSGTI